MAPADAAVLDLPKQTPARRFHALTATGNVSDALAPAPHEFALSTPMRVVAVEPITPTRASWIPAPEGAPIGLGPSVAELTLGRPPRAPRPGE